MQCLLLLHGYQLQYNVELNAASIMDSVGQHAVVDFFLYLFTGIVTYCALFMLAFIILLLQITDTLDKTL